MSRKLDALLLEEIERILRSNPEKMFSKEEILNFLSHLGRDTALEQILAMLEIESFLRKRVSSVSVKCKGGTVYYNWNQ